MPPAPDSTSAPVVDATPASLLTTRLEIEYAVSGTPGSTAGDGITARALHTWTGDGQRYTAVLSAAGTAGSQTQFVLHSRGNIVGDIPVFTSASFGTGGGLNASQAPDGSAPELLHLSENGMQQQLMLSAGAFDLLTLTRALPKVSEPGLRVTLVERQGARIVQLTRLTDESIVVTNVPMRSRRFHFDDMAGAAALIIWLVPDQRWAPARMQMFGPTGAFTFDAVSIRHGAGAEVRPADARQ